MEWVSSLTKNVMINKPTFGVLEKRGYLFGEGEAVGVGFSAAIANLLHVVWLVFVRSTIATRLV